MAQALAAGISSSNSELRFCIYDPSDEACDSFSNGLATGASVARCESNQALINQCELVFLAVKPQSLESAIGGLSFDAQPLVVSVVAGFQLYHLQRMVGMERVIRVMPNTPCLIGKGASGFVVGAGVTPEDKSLVKCFLESVGLAVEVDERQLDAVTGLSGSGPAYVFTFIESLIDGAVLTGLPRATARKLTLQTVIGSAEMMLQTGDHPGVLRDRVTSPGGTTIEGLKSLEENSFRDAVMSAVFAATERSRELGG